MEAHLEEALAASTLKLSAYSFVLSLLELCLTPSPESASVRETRKPLEATTRETWLHFRLPGSGRYRARAPCDSGAVDFRSHCALRAESWITLVRRRRQWGSWFHAPWPAWDWSPSEHRGFTLALHHWGVAARKRSHRPLRVSDQGLLLPGLPSGVVPTASVPATAVPSLLLPVSEQGRRAARASRGGKSAGSFFPHFGCSALRYGDWRVDSSLGVGEASLRWESMRESGLETSCCLSQLWAGAAVVIACRFCLSGLSWTRGGRRESDMVFEIIPGAAFLLKPKACPALRLWSLTINLELKIKIVSFLSPSKNGFTLCYVFFGFCFLVVFEY